MKNDMDFVVQCGTPSDKNYLFGFHDLVSFNRSNDKLLSIEVDIINRPPIAGERAGVGYCLWEEKKFIRLGETEAYNFPQGSRQQWLSDTHFVVNNKVEGDWGSEIYDVSQGCKVESYHSTAHCVTNDKKTAFGLDYSRLHRLGGYGYVGVEDAGIDDATPEYQGIWSLDLNSGNKALLVSIKDVAETDLKSSDFNGSHHYVTHLVLNPSSNRIAFLHRFFLSDGGIRTRLMTVGVNGQNLRCLAVGFLSHFDWKDDESIFIWGRSGGSVDALRSNRLISNPIVFPLLKAAKGLVKNFLEKTTSQLSMSFLLVKDMDEPIISPIAEGILLEDGHPMVNPINRDFVVTDNYPDEAKERTLMLYSFSQNEKVEVCRQRMIDDRPNTDLYKEYTQGCDKRVLQMMSPETFSFTRSGLHCDFHPRWNADGTMVAFDSIHEGTRKIYVVDVKPVLEP